MTKHECRMSKEIPSSNIECRKPRLHPKPLIMRGPADRYSIRCGVFALCGRHPIDFARGRLRPLQEFLNQPLGSFWGNPEIAKSERTFAGVQYRFQIL